MLKKDTVAGQAMRIQGRPGSPAEKSHYANSSLPGGIFPHDRTIMAVQQIMN